MEGDTDHLYFGLLDYIVFGSVILASLLLGIFFAVRDKRKNTSKNFFLGNKKQKALPLSISYIVTFMSSIIFLGTPAEIYLYGLQYSVQLIGVFSGFILAAVIVVPLYHPLAVTSCYEYYYLRYGSNSVRYLGVALGAMFYTLYMGVVINGAALALESTAGLSTWLTIVIFSTASITYTSLGGIKAVIWTDVLQSVIMLAGIITVLIKTLSSIGGNLADVGEERLQLFDFNPDPTVRHTFWTLILGAVPHFFYTAITQAGVQRILSTPTLNAAKRIIYYAAPIYCFVWLLSMFGGISVFAYFKNKRCDPVAAEIIENPNQIIPHIMMELFRDYPGIPGLFIASLAAASLSTISSGLSSLAAVTSVDILKVAKPDITDETLTSVSKVFVIMFGLIAAALAFILSNIEGPLGQIMAGFTGAVAGPDTGMFLVSVFFRRSRPKAVLVSALIVLALSLWVILGQTFSPNIKQTPYLPLGPTDNCYKSESVTGDIYIYNSTGVSSNISTLMSYSQTTTQFSDDSNERLSILDTMYSLSYMYIHLVGAILTIILAILGSLLTQPKNVEPVKESCILPLSIFIPSVIKRRLPYWNGTSERNMRNDVSETDSML